MSPVLRIFQPANKTYDQQPKYISRLFVALCLYLLRLRQQPLLPHKSQPFVYFSLFPNLPKMMHMTFYWGKQVTVLFDSWKTDSYLSYFITLLALFLFSVFYQYMEDKRIRFKTVARKVVDTTVETPLLARLGAKKNAERYGSAVLFGVNSAIGYMLMLAIMSFNGGVFVAVVLGLSLGYLLFRCGEEEVLVVENPCACA